MPQRATSSDRRPRPSTAVRLVAAALMSGAGVLLLATGHPAGFGWALIVLATAVAANWDSSSKGPGVRATGRRTRLGAVVRVD